MAVRNRYWPYLRPDDPWTVTHAGSQKKPGKALKASQANKSKKEDKSALGNFAIQNGTDDLQNKKTKGLKSK